jgi:hypothetical protein
MNIEWERRKEKNQKEELDVVVNIILKLILGRVGTDYIDVAQVSDQRRAFVNTVMNLWIP